MIDIDLEQPCNSNVPKPNPYRSDVDLGDLDFRFDPKQGRFATDKEIASLNSWLVIVDCKNNVEHHLHSSRAELYLADNLRNRDHSYKNGPELPNFQTNNVRTTHYPQGCNDFTKDLCVLWSNSELFIGAFQDLKFCVPEVIKFVLGPVEWHQRRAVPGALPPSMGMHEVDHPACPMRYDTVLELSFCSSFHRIE
jgi:hypothetical protein